MILRTKTSIICCFWTKFW